MSYSPLFLQGITQCLYVLKKKKKKLILINCNFWPVIPRKQTNKRLCIIGLAKKLVWVFLNVMEKPKQTFGQLKYLF